MPPEHPPLKAVTAPDCAQSQVSSLYLPIDMPIPAPGQDRGHLPLPVHKLVSMGHPWALLFRMALPLPMLTSLCVHVGEALPAPPPGCGPILNPLPPTDSHCHVAGGSAQRHALLLLRGRHLPGLLLLWLDRVGALPREGMGSWGWGGRECSRRAPGSLPEPTYLSPTW